MKPFVPLLLLALPACRARVSPEVAGEVRLPRPTDPRGEYDEDELRRGRERWIEELHRAAPGVDWRAIEARNREAERERRNELRRSGSYAPGQAHWEEVGSRNQAGHTRCAALGPERAGFRWAYLGSANGGVWRGPLDGSDWRPLSDGVFGGVDEIAVLAPANLADEDVVLFRQGTQVLRSDDGGATWTAPAGLSGIGELRRLTTLADAQQTLLLHARANVGSGQRAVLFASTDLGQSFQVRNELAVDWPGDVWTPRFGPGAGSDVYLLQKGKLRRSTDGGASFTYAGEVDLGASQGSLQGSEAGAPHLYAATLNAGSWRVWRSADGGATFTDQGAPPQFWGGTQSLVAFSSAPDRLFTGGVEGFRSANGGALWSKVNGWGEYYGNPAQKLHADLRGLGAIPDPDAPGSADLLFVNTDGGTYLSTDYGQTVSNLCLEGLGVAQFYSTHTSVRDAALVVGGTQDQGYQRGFKEPWHGNGPSTPMDQLISGDYGHLTSSDGDHDYLYSTYPGFVLVQVGEQSPALHGEDFPSGSSHLWLPPVVADPLDEQAFFFLADRLWRYTPTGGQWSPTQHSSQPFQLGGASYLSALAFAPTDPQRAYAVANNGDLWWSVDHGVTWTAAANKGPGSHYFYGNALAVHPSDALRAVVGGSGYSSPGVKESLDGGQTWQPLASGLPATLVYDVAWAQDGSDDLYAATESGAYRFDSGAGTWVNLMGLEAPATTYWSVEVVAGAELVRFGTYGRGIWDWVYGTSEALLFGDGFESGDLESGAWLSKNARAKVLAAAAYSGAWGAHLLRTTWIERAVSTLGCAEVRLEFAHRSENYEGAEQLHVEWWDGAAWQAIASLGTPQWKEKSYLLPAQAANLASFKVRFRTDAVGKHSTTGKKKRSQIDDVRILGQ